MSNITAWAPSTRIFRSCFCASTMIGTASTTIGCPVHHQQPHANRAPSAAFQTPTYPQIFPVFLEALELLVDVILEQVAVALLEAGGQQAQLALEEGLVEHLAYGDAGAGRHGAVGGADTPLGGADAVLAQLALLEPVDLLVAVGDDVAAVRHEQPVADAFEALRLELGELIEEGGDGAVGFSSVG